MATATQERLVTIKPDQLTLKYLKIQLHTLALTKLEDINPQELFTIILKAYNIQYDDVLAAEIDKLNLIRNRLLNLALKEPTGKTVLNLRNNLQNQAFLHRFNINPEILIIFTEKFIENLINQALILQSLEFNLNHDELFDLVIQVFHIEHDSKPLSVIASESLNKLRYEILVLASARENIAIITEIQNELKRPTYLNIHSLSPELSNLLSNDQSLRERISQSLEP